MQCYHFDEIFCHWLHRKLSNDKFQKDQWRKFNQNSNITVSLIQIYLVVKCKYGHEYFLAHMRYNIN